MVGKQFANKFCSCLRTVSKHKLRAFFVSSLKYKIWKCKGVSKHLSLSRPTAQASTQCRYGAIGWSSKFCTAASRRSCFVPFRQSFWSQLHLLLPNLPKDYFQTFFLIKCLVYHSLFHPLTEIQVVISAFSSHTTWCLTWLHSWVPGRETLSADSVCWCVKP